MRSRIFFASAAFLLLLSTKAFSCGPYWWYPQDYLMFRVYDKEAMNSLDPDRDANCEAWRALTGGKATAEDIRKVVYGYSMDQIRGLLKAKRSRNSFARYIAASQDREVADFLLLAKTCELSRKEIIDPWYYPSKEDPVVASLEEVAGKGQAYRGGRLEDRYVLQAVRALFSLGRFEDIVSLWQSRDSQLKEGVIKHMTRGYVAGAAYNLGDKTKAKTYYIENGDLNSLYANFPEFRSKVSVLEFAAGNCPDSPEVASMLQEVVARLENTFSEGYQSESDIQDVIDLTRASIKGAGNAREPGIWYYTAAFLSDLRGEDARAQEYLAQAENSRKSDFLDGSVKVLRMYLDAKSSTFDAEYEARLLEQVKWLDQKVQDGITPNVKTITSEGYNLHVGLSYYYWNDMLRKILIGYVAPKMDKTNPVLSLRLRNMADNRLLNIVDSYSSYWYDNDWHEKAKVYTMKEYRALKDEENMFDYSNYFFKAMDTLDLRDVIRYEMSMGSGTSEMDRFLDQRGFIDHDYVRELIGTRYIRERNYQEAVRYLSMVSSDYGTRTNVYPYFARQPFEYAEKQAGASASYKLDFAREMASLEEKMKSGDPDVMGSAMLRYGLGLRSSFNYCWALTQYHLNYGDEWYEADYTREARKDAEVYIKQGCKAIRDPETAAKAYAGIGRFKTAAQNFPGTRTANEILTKCDKLIDYRFQGRRSAMTAY